MTREQEGKDDTCPLGHVPVTYFAKGEAGKEAEDGVAGMGPCGLRVQVQE